MINTFFAEYREEKIGTARQCKLVVRDKIGSIAGAVQVFSVSGIHIIMNMDMQ